MRAVSSKTKEKNYKKFKSVSLLSCSWSDSSKVSVCKKEPSRPVKGITKTWITHLFLKIKFSSVTWVLFEFASRVALLPFIHTCVQWTDHALCRALRESKETCRGFWCSWVFWKVPRGDWSTYARHVGSGQWPCSYYPYVCLCACLRACLSEN